MPVYMQHWCQLLLYLALASYLPNSPCICSLSAFQQSIDEKNKALLRNKGSSQQTLSQALSVSQWGPQLCFWGSYSKGWGCKLKGWDLNPDLPLNSHLCTFCPTRQFPISHGKKYVLSGCFTQLMGSLSWSKKLSSLCALDIYLHKVSEKWSRCSLLLS